MTRSVLGKRLLAVILSIMVAVTFMPVFAQNAYAASKAPAKVTIKSVTVNASNVTVQWGKAKNAKKYKVFVQTGADGWKYWKSVKASKKNKKKYSDKLKYKLQKSGKKYKIYKKKNPYRLVKTTTAQKYTYTGKYSTTYRFVLRAVNGKKASAYSTARSIRTQAKPQPKPPAPAKPETGLHSGDSEGTGSSPSTTQPTQPTISKPGQVSNLTTAVSNYEDRFRIDLTWSAASGATEYEVYRRTGSGATATNYDLIKTTTKCNYALATSQISTKFTFKVVAKNSAGKGAEVTTSCVTPAELPKVNTGEYSINSETAWNQYLNKMLGYYNAELSKRGVSINSTNKADEFQKLQAIIQVMHDYVGYAERTSSDYSNFPTGYQNWYYHDTSSTTGEYYDGTQYISTIEFYGACDAIAWTQEFLAKKAGLDVYVLGEYSSSHKYAMICANNVWYNADPAIYMAPGNKGLKYPGWKDPSKFTEVKYNNLVKISDGPTFTTSQLFRLKNVFYGLTDSVGSNGGASFDGEHNTGLDIGVNPESATYTSSDESILSFDEANGTCTIHKAGVVYVTITYTNVKAGGQIPSISTTISVNVKE